MNSTTHQPNRKLSRKGHPPDGGLPGTSSQGAVQGKGEDRPETFPDYPPYPPDEDIYSQYIKETEVDPEEPSRFKKPMILADLINQLDFKKEMLADDLDVPGSELDDEQERIGSEDEENNYYSIGGDAHDDLDEANGEGE